MIEINSEKVQDILNTSGSMISDLMPLLLFFLGIIIACYILEKLLTTFLNKNNNENKND
ncbi:MAG: hypothetical protein PHC47_03965 [Clostridia bacterium]|nr:hypothetical protein [Clostridia bacterium]